MKKVFVELAALTRVCWGGVVEVPDNATQEQLEDLVEAVYDAVDGGEYSDDTDYWEKGSCYYHTDEGMMDTPFFKARLIKGQWKLKEVTVT